jgi:intracellular multiplication protein IcmB
MKIVNSFIEGIEGLLAWISSSVKQSTVDYCELETADDEVTLVANDGSLISIIELKGSYELMGYEEFSKIHKNLTQTLYASMSKPGHSIQVFFDFDQSKIRKVITKSFAPSVTTANALNLDLDDLFEERKKILSKYCSDEKVYLVLWTKPSLLTKDQIKANKDQQNESIKNKELSVLNGVSQNLLVTLPSLRNGHDAFVSSLITDLSSNSFAVELLNVKKALKAVRKSVDDDFTDDKWSPVLPGDKLTGKEYNNFQGDPSDLLWPNLPKQLIPRNAENIDLKTVQIGDKIYSSVFIDLFPKDIQTFISLFNRTLNSKIPWRISFFIESEGSSSIAFKSTLAGLLSFASYQNKLLSDASNLLTYIKQNKDEALVRLRVSASTWAPADNQSLLRTRAAELAKAIQGWGSCEVSEVCGDPFAGAASSMLGITSDNVASASIAPLSDVVYMLPITRPSSSWKQGALLFRTPDGKLWPFQPGSKEQTTWIDLIYARPGSGKSVLSNALNLALCLSGGISRLPRIAIIDVGPSSSGLISLLREALPNKQKHLVAYHRIQMTKKYSINPFDTQLGMRFPTAQERSFLVNLLILLSTPVGSSKPYDGISDLAGLVIDEMYKKVSDNEMPSLYTKEVSPILDAVIEENNINVDEKTTWYEITDALFKLGFIREATLSQRHATPLLSDAVSVCRTSSIEDLYKDLTVPTGENILSAFTRMISSAIREYPILSNITKFDVGNAKVVALDLDEVAKSGGASADRQTAVMYMLARNILAKDYYLTLGILDEIPSQYRKYHEKRINEIQEDPKRIVYDEFHRTSKSQAVRDQVVVDMREGRKWKVQIALISQSVDDFDSVMVEFGTGIYVMDAGPSTAIEKTTKIFGLSDTAKTALSTRVHGPREGGATFLVQYATKQGINVQLLTLTLGPIELWSFSTTSDDARLRNKLYTSIGPKEARQLLARLFPSGSISKVVDHKIFEMEKNDSDLIKEKAKLSVVDDILEQILDAYSKNPQVNKIIFK